MPMRGFRQLFANGSDFSPNYVGTCILLFVIAFFGGSSRADSLSQAIVRAICVAAMIAWTIAARPPRIATLRWPIALLGLAATIVGLQLVPLAPGLWTALPGRAFYAASASVAGMAQPWRPINLVPDRGLSALFSLLVPGAAIVAIAHCGVRDRARLIGPLIALVIFSAVLGLAQLSEGREGMLHWYAYSSDAYAIGFFANRNHQALLLASALPMLAAWAVTPPIAAATNATRGRMRTPGRGGIAIAIGLFLVVMIPTTGSRAGVVLAIVGIVIAAAMTGRPAVAAIKAMRRRQRRWLIGGAGVALLAVIAAAALSGRSEAFVRLRGLDTAQDLRARTLPIVIDMARDFFPVGAGFGSFEAVYRRFEPFSMLSNSYLNEAHNDLAQIVVEGGLVAILLLVMTLGWWVWASVRAWRLSVSPSVHAARAGSGIILLGVLASATDYPARTPLIMAIVAVAACWLAGAGVEEPRQRRAER